MTPVVKTSGSEGLHLYVAIVRGPTQKRVWTFAKRLAKRLEQQHPIYHSGIGQAARIVVADRGEWERVWARMWHNHHPVPPVPAVDFDRELVIVAAMGARHTGGYSIRVDEARSYGDHVTIHAVETSPGRGCVTTQAFTAPVDVVKIPRTAAEIRFRTSPVVRECD